MTAGLIAFFIGSAVLSGASVRPLTHHMSMHILLMNVVAPLAAHGLAGVSLPGWLSTGRTLVATTLAQLGLLWGIHTPAVLEASAAAPMGALAIQALLLTAAVCFWLSVLSQKGPDRWRALLALLITGKLVCLLAALIVFAPRLLYPEIAHAHAGVTQASPLADQQLAGLLMISACPLTYVLEAIVITAVWLKELGESEPAAERIG